MAVKKKKTNKKPSQKKERKSSNDEVRVEKILIENFVSLQKVMVNLSVKFDNLTSQISKLLELFEISAKSLAEKDFNLDKNSKDNTKIIEKIDEILDQNKTIARGLTLMHEKITGVENIPPMPTSEMQRFFPQQRMPIKPLPKPTIRQADSEEYSKSISSNERKFQ